MNADEIMLIVLIVYIIILCYLFLPYFVVDDNTELVFKPEDASMAHNKHIRLLFQQELNCPKDHIISNELDACIPENLEGEKIEIDDYELSTCKSGNMYYVPKKNGCCKIGTEYNDKLNRCGECLDSEYYNIGEKRCMPKGCNRGESWDETTKTCYDTVDCSDNQFYNRENKSCENLNSVDPGSGFDGYDVTTNSKVKLLDKIEYDGMIYDIKWQTRPEFKGLQNVGNVYARITYVDKFSGHVSIDIGGKFINPVYQKYQRNNNRLESLVTSSCVSITNWLNYLNRGLYQIINKGYTISPRLGNLLTIIFTVLGYQAGNVMVCDPGTSRYYNMVANVFVLLIAFIIGLTWIFTKQRKILKGNEPPSISSFLTKVFAILGGLVLLFMISLFIARLSKDITIPSTETLTTYISYTVLLIGFLSIVYLFIPGKVNANDKSLSNLIKKLIFYIPCAFINLISGIKKQYNLTNPVWMLIFKFEVTFLVFTLLIPYLIALYIKSGGKQLLKEPIYTNSLREIAKYKDLVPSNQLNEENVLDYKSYNYSISSWFYINPHSLDTSDSYSKETNIISYGDRPKILYNGKKNKLKVHINKGGQGVIKIELDEKILLQKWNHLVINYDRGTLDIFMNNKLVKTLNEIVPHVEEDSIIIGSNGGIQGGICNVVYYDKVLSKPEITKIYNSLKSKTPPVI